MGSRELLQRDPLSRLLTQSATGILKEFNDAGVLLPADIHIAAQLTRMMKTEDEHLALLIALTVRAVRAGSACLNLETLPVSPQDPRTADWALEASSWPDLDWRAFIAESLAARAADSPLVLDDDRLYLRRYWEEESLVLGEIAGRLELPLPAVSADLEGSLAAYFPSDAEHDSDDQKAAARLSATSRLSIITGGPGSGKTTTVARLLGVLLDGDSRLRIGLAAPTGKAAARMVEAIAESTKHPTFPATHAPKIQGLQALTLHRLLRYSPHRGFLHNRENPVMYDVVIVDETSMVSLPLMARLLEAVSHETTLIFVGDPHQLASVEVGAVFTDLVEGLESLQPSPVAELVRTRRFGAEIGELAAATNAGKAALVLRLLAEPSTQDHLGEIDPREILDEVLPAYRLMRDAARSGDAPAALKIQKSVQVLCAHREGPSGASTWNDFFGRAAMGAHEYASARWHAGQPIMITRNDYGLNLFNGDSGVVIQREGRLVAAFERPEGIRYVPIGQIGDAVAGYAVTVHRAQGSQFDRIFVILPAADSRILTRELFYTAITRAQNKLRIAGTTQAVSAAITRRATRASGLGARLVHRT